MPTPTPTTPYPNTNITFYLWNWWGYAIGFITASSVSDPKHPASNTLFQTGDLTWRSIGTSDAWLVRDFGLSRRISAVGIVGHNLSTTGTFRIRVSNDPAFGSSVLDMSGVPAWESVYSPSELAHGVNSEYFDAIGYPSTKTKQSILQKPISLVDFPTPVHGQYVRIDISDPDNTNPYFQIAYIYSGERYTPEYGITSGYTRNRSDIARRERSTSGQYLFGATILKRIVISLQIELIQHKQAVEIWMLFLTLLGSREEFLIRAFSVADGFEPSSQFYNTIYCRFVQVPPLKNNIFERYTISMQVEEIL